MTVMIRLTDARVLTRRETGYESPQIDADCVEALIADRTLHHKGLPAARTSSWLVVVSETSTSQNIVTRLDSWKEDPRRKTTTRGYRVHTKATSTTSTTVSMVSGLMRASRRDEALRRLAPDRRATFERIRRLREQIGSVPFDIVHE